MSDNPSLTIRKRLLRREPQDLLKMYRLHVGQEFADALADEIAGRLDLPAAIGQIESENGIAIDRHEWEWTITSPCLPCRIVLSPPPFSGLLCFEQNDGSGNWSPVDPTTYRVIDAGRDIKPGIIERLTSSWPPVSCEHATSCCSCDYYRIRFQAGFLEGGPATVYIPHDLIKAIALTAENLAGYADEATARAVRQLRGSTHQSTVHSYLD